MLLPALGGACAVLSGLQSVPATLNLKQLLFLASKDLAAVLRVGCALLVLSSIGLFCNILSDALAAADTCNRDIQDHPQGGNLHLRGWQTFLPSLVAEAQKYPVGQHQMNNYPAASMSGKWEETKALVPVQTICSSGPIAICVTGFSGWPFIWVTA